MFLQRLDFRLGRSRSHMDLKPSQRSVHYIQTSIAENPFCEQLGEVLQIRPSNHITNSSDSFSNNNRKPTLQMNNLNLYTTPPLPRTRQTSKMMIPPEAKVEFRKTAGFYNNNRMGKQNHNVLVEEAYPRTSQFGDNLSVENSPKAASLRIFAAVMLNAWRKRREEIKELMNEISDLKHRSVKGQNQLHVFNTLIRVEQKRNDDLNRHLKRSLEEKMQTQASCDALTDSIMNLEADGILLEKELNMKDEEIEALNSILTDTQSELFKAMSQQRQLQADLSILQRKVQELEYHKDELENEVFSLTNEVTHKEKVFQKQLQAKNERLAMMAEESREFEVLFIKMKEYQSQIREFSCIEMKYKTDMEVLRNEIVNLRHRLANTLVCRIKTCSKIPFTLPRVSSQLIHWTIYTLLPAIPPPTIT